MRRVLVTGGSGKLGRAVLEDLVAGGYKVLDIDQTLPKVSICPTVRVELSDYGQVLEAVLGGVDEHRGRPFDAVVHLAAIPAPGLFANVFFNPRGETTAELWERAARVRDARPEVFGPAELFVWDYPRERASVCERIVRARPDLAPSLTTLRGAQALSSGNAAESVDLFAACDAIAAGIPRRFPARWCVPALTGAERFGQEIPVEYRHSYQET